METTECMMCGWVMPMTDEAMDEHGAMHSMTEDILEEYGVGTQFVITIFNPETGLSGTASSEDLDDPFQ